jgi:hypothetical protein
MDLLERLKERALPKVATVTRGQNYNYGLLWYMRTDGEIVQLQGDPQNRAYYEDKGYVVLRQESGIPGVRSESQEWEQVERPKVIAAQRKRATVINAIRRLEDRNPGVTRIGDFEIMTIEELEQQLRDMGQTTGQATRVVVGPTREDNEDAAMMQLMTDVETNVSIEEIQSKLERTPSGQVVGHGFDPLTEARRAQPRTGPRREPTPT